MYLAPIPLINKIRKSKNYSGIISIESLTSFLFSVADPDSGSGIRCFLTLVSGIRYGKSPDQGSGINIPDHIFESLVTIFWLEQSTYILCQFNFAILIRDPA